MTYLLRPSRSAVCGLAASLLLPIALGSCGTDAVSRAEVRDTDDDGKDLDVGDDTERDDDDA